MKDDIYILRAPFSRTLRTEYGESDIVRRVRKLFASQVFTGQTQALCDVFLAILLFVQFGINSNKTGIKPRLVSVTGTDI